MLLESTAQHGPRVSFTEALIRGIAPDGSLYLPIDWPEVTLDELASWQSLSFPALAVTLARRLLTGELPNAEIERLTGEALDFPVPTVPILGRHHVLELFHGPTLAFKDFGARFLARFFGYLARERGRGGHDSGCHVGGYGQCCCPRFLPCAGRACRRPVPERESLAVPGSADGIAR